MRRFWRISRMWCWRIRRVFGPRAYALRRLTRSGARSERPRPRRSCLPVNSSNVSRDRGQLPLWRNRRTSLFRRKRLSIYSTDLLEWSSLVPTTSTKKAITILRLTRIRISFCRCVRGRWETASFAASQESTTMRENANWVTGTSKDSVRTKWSYQDPTANSPTTSRTAPLERLTAFTTAMTRSGTKWSGRSRTLTLWLMKNLIDETIGIHNFCRIEIRFEKKWNQAKTNIKIKGKLLETFRKPCINYHGKFKY